MLAVQVVGIPSLDLCTAAGISLRAKTSQEKEGTDAEWKWNMAEVEAGERDGREGFNSVSGKHRSTVADTLGKAALTDQQLDLGGD